jgi:hypothetical protein
MEKIFVLRQHAEGGAWAIMSQSQYVEAAHFVRYSLRDRACSQPRPGVRYGQVTVGHVVVHEEDGSLDITGAQPNDLPKSGQDSEMLRPRLADDGEYTGM